MVLAELDDYLRSRPANEKLTPDEELLLQRYKSRALGDFAVGYLASSVVTWIATRSLSHAQRFSTSIGSGLAVGLWRFGRSLDSSVEKILELNESRMQEVLTAIIVTKHPDDESKMNIVRKHFYAEEVFSDQNSDKPHLKWRRRNIYSDITSPQTSKAVEDSNYHKPQAQQAKQITRITGEGDMIADPLDCMFGEVEASKEIAHPESNAASRRQLRKHKRAHRHHRARHTED